MNPYKRLQTIDRSTIATATLLILGFGIAAFSTTQTEALQDMEVNETELREGFNQTQIMQECRENNGTVINRTRPGNVTVQSCRYT